jgi:transposase
MKQVNPIGVDVDSEELVCALQRAGQRLPLAAFADTAAGHRKFIRWATKGGHLARVCLEATGIYSLEFALALHQAKNVEVMVVNPRAIKDFVRACMQRAKTDAVDASGILDYLERMPFTAWQPPAPEILELQAINRRIVQLDTELTREKNRRHASEFAGASADAIAHDIEINIRHLERRLERMHETGPCRAGSVPLRVGHFDPSPAAHQQSWQQPPARRALHARPGGHSTRAQRQSLLRQTRCRREEADAGTWSR